MNSIASTRRLGVSASKGSQLERRRDGQDDQPLCQSLQEIADQHRGMLLPGAVDFRHLMAA
jgi:hypothetical protein